MASEDHGNNDGNTVRSVAKLKNTAVELATTEIRRSILSGALPPGERFNINKLAERLGLSHIPVREALNRLEMQGLVLLSPARSGVVAPLEVTELDAIYRLRELLEPTLAGQSAPMHTADSLDTIEKLWSLAYQINPVDSDDHWNNHIEFHKALLMPAASGWDLRILQQLWNASTRYTRLVFDARYSEPKQHQRRADVHRGLLEAAARRDPGLLSDRVLAHLQHNHTVSREALEQVGRQETET